MRLQRRGAEASAELMPRRRRGGMGWETVGSFSTRRRGDTEEDAEKQERDGGEALNSGVRREAEEAEKTEEGSPSLARMDRLKPAPPRGFPERNANAIT